MAESPPNCSKTQLAAGLHTLNNQNLGVATKVGPLSCSRLQPAATVAVECGVTATNLQVGPCAVVPASRLICNIHVHYFLHQAQALHLVGCCKTECYSSGPPEHCKLCPYQELMSICVLSMSSKEAAHCTSTVLPLDVQFHSFTSEQSPTCVIVSQIPRRPSNSSIQNGADTKLHSMLLGLKGMLHTNVNGSRTAPMPMEDPIQSAGYRRGPMRYRQRLA